MIKKENSKVAMIHDYSWISKQHLIASQLWYREHARTMWAPSHWLSLQCAQRINCRIYIKLLSTFCHESYKKFHIIKFHVFPFHPWEFHFSLLLFCLFSVSWVLTKWDTWDNELMSRVDFWWHWFPDIIVHGSSPSVLGKASSLSKIWISSHFQIYSCDI